MTIQYTVNYLLHDQCLEVLTLHLVQAPVLGQGNTPTTLTFNVAAGTIFNVFNYDAV